MNVLIAFLLLLQVSGDITRFVLTDFQRIQDVYMLDAKTAIIVQQTSDYPVQVVDLSSQKIIHQLMRKGKGPGELENILASAYNVSQNTLYLIGSDRKFVELKMNDKHQVISTREKVLKTTFNPHSITISGNHVHIGTSIRLNGKAITEYTEPIECGIAVNLTSLATDKTYHFEMSQLGLQRNDDIQNVEFIQFNTRILPDGNDTHIIIERIPHVLVYDNNNRHVRTIDLTELTGLPNIGASYRQDFGVWALTSPPVSEYAIRHEGAYYIGYGYFGQTPYKGLIRIASGQVSIPKQFDQPKSYPPVMRCSMGNELVACYNGYMSFDDVVVVTHTLSSFFDKP